MDVLVMQCIRYFSSWSLANPNLLISLLSSAVLMQLYQVQVRDDCLGWKWANSQNIHASRTRISLKPLWTSIV
jgi:hypothetical protein